MAPGEGAGGSGREVQHVWVYCEGPEAAEVVAFCGGARAGGVRLEAQVLETRPAHLEWQGPLYDRVPRLPAPYVSGERREFWADAGALLAASVANRRRRAEAAVPPAAGTQGEQHRPPCGERWPALLVTDREKLAEAAASPGLRHSLSRAAGLPDRDLLPVVMAHDFGRLLGVLVAGPPLASCRSMALQAPPAAAAAARRGTQGGPPPAGPRARSAGGARPACHHAAVAAPPQRRASSPGAPLVARLASAMAPQARSVGLRTGVYVQNATSIRGASSAGVTPAGGGAASAPLAAPGGDPATAAPPAPARFGARCLALFEDGWGAYAALSPDGACSAEACGPWAVVNGHVVIRGAASLNRLSRTGAAQRALGVGYPELVHVPLEELEADFSAPVSLAEVIPQRDQMRLTLHGRPGSPRGAAAAAATAASGEAPLMPQLSMTYTSDAFDLVLGSSRTARSSDKAQAQEAPPPPSTAVHALVALSGLDSPEHAARRASTPDSGSPVHPRLLGVERGLTMTPLQRASLFVAAAPDADAALDADDGGPASAAAAEARPWWPGVLQRLCRYVGQRSKGEAAGAAGSFFDTCPLRPGSYQFTTGEPGAFEFKKLELWLHADGACDLREDSRAGSLRSVPGGTSWHVEGDLLVLRSRDPAAPGYVVREARGNKSVERQVEKVELPLELLLDRSVHTPPEQVNAPFPGHEAQEASRLVFGVVDPQSPVLSGLRSRPDRLPYHAFEKELRLIGIPCDHVLTDLRFIDRDEDGLISAAEMQLLHDYGAPRAAPEDIHSLREALVSCYGSLDAAWRQLEDCAKAGQEAAQKAANKKSGAKGAKGGPVKDSAAPLEDGGCIRPAAFEDFLLRAGSDTPPGQVKGAAPLDNHKLRDWVARTTAEDREAVFQSLNPNNNASIDQVDFMSLSLHAAVLAVRRLDHLRSWLAEEFGTGTEVYRQVFQSIGRAKTFNRAAFVDGLEALGYPLGQRAIESIFSILDRNFDGEVSLQEFSRLAEFSAEQVFKTLDALKRYVDESMGGVQAAFKAFVQREKALQSLQAMPSYASAAAFEKACKQAGFLKAFPDADLKLIFVFISEASGKRSNRFLTASDWAVLEGFNSRALSGSPARLRKMLEERYGGTAQAFERMHTSWLTRALAKGLKQTAIARLVHALVAGGDEGGGAGGAAGASATAARGEALRSPMPCAGAVASAAAGAALARQQPRQPLPRPAVAERGPSRGSLAANAVQDSKLCVAVRPRSAVGPAPRRRHNLLPRPASRGPGRECGVRHRPTSAIDWGLAA